MAAFKDKGRVSGILDKVPVYAVLVEDLGLRGASLHAFHVSASATRLHALLQRWTQPSEYFCVCRGVSM